MDRTDRNLLEALQRDSSRSVADVAELVSLSPSACHRRIKALEEQGLIAGYAARVDPRRLRYDPSRLPGAAAGSFGDAIVVFDPPDQTDGRLSGQSLALRPMAAVILIV